MSDESQNLQLPIEGLELTRTRFTTPASLMNDEPDPTWETSETESVFPEEHDSSRETASSISASRTKPTATRGEIASGMATAIIGALTVLCGVAWWFSRRPDGRSLRLPTDTDYEAVAKPLGRIGARHAPVELAPAVVKDIFDASEAAGATMNYLRRGPLMTKPPVIEEGEQQ